jgi:hypothetical protein
MMPPIVAVSEYSNQIPGYPWFQQQDASQNAQNSLVEMNHIERDAQADRSRISFGDQDRTDKVGFSNREAIERNGLGVLSSVERNAGENRVTTLQSSLDARAQTSANFATTLLSLKDNQIAAAANIGEAKVTQLNESLRSQHTTLREGSMNREAVANVGLQGAVETGRILNKQTWQNGDLKNQSSWQYGRIREHQERGFGAVSLQAAHIRNEQEKAFALLGLQAERNHGDTNRRMANYRAETDRRVETVGAVLALQAANIKGELALQAANNTAKLEECCCTTKQVIVDTAGVTQGLIASSATASLRDALAAAQQEALLLRFQHRGPNFPT